MNKISDLIEDPVNLNLGTPEGADLLARSLEEVGYARSLVMSADGVILCGNQTHKASLLRGDGEKQPIIVETEGDVPVIVKRKDVTSGTPLAVKIAAYDNLANQRGLAWRPDARQVVEAHGVPVQEIGWTLEELGGGEPEASGSDEEEDPAPTGIGTQQLVVECRDERDAQELFERLTREGRKCRVLTL